MFLRCICGNVKIIELSIFLSAYSKGRKVNAVFGRQTFLCCNNLATATKLTLKGTSFNIQNFDCCLERFNIYLLEIAKQFLTKKCYNVLANSQNFSFAAVARLLQHKKIAMQFFIDRTCKCSLNIQNFEYGKEFFPYLYCYCQVVIFHKIKSKL